MFIQVIRKCFIRHRSLLGSRLGFSPPQRGRVSLRDPEVCRGLGVLLKDTSAGRIITAPGDRHCLSTLEHPAATLLLILIAA